MLLGVALAVSALGGGTAHSQSRTLELYFTHTKESIKVVYKRNGKYVPSALRDLNRFLRDWRRNESTKMDPELFDLLWEVQQEFGGRKINVVSAYRSPATNSMLRKRSRGVARNSQHMRGRAIDFFIPGANLSKLRAEGMKRQVGGVGYYPSSGSPFVHFDTGGVRSWPRMSRSELARLFPDGKTLHMPSSGKPLSGYAAAKKAEEAGKLTALNTRGGNGGGGFSLFGFGGSGRQVAAAENTQRGILPQKSRAKPVETAKPKQPAPVPVPDQPVRVQTASLGPVATSTAEPKDEPGFFRQLPGASLGGLINRFRRNEPREAPEVIPVSLPPSELTAVAVATADSSGAPSAPDAIGQILTDDNVNVPIPRLAPRDGISQQPARAPGLADPAAGEAPGGPVGEAIQLAALPPQRPQYDGIGTDATANPLGYANDTGPVTDGASPLDAAAAFVPRSALAPRGATFGAVEGQPPSSLFTPQQLVRTSLSPVRGASPLLIADASSMQEAAFADLSAPDRVAASKGGVLLADGFLGAPSRFTSDTNWPSTERFTGLRITVFAKPRS